MAALLHHWEGNAFGSGKRHIVVAPPFQQPHHWPVSRPSIVLTDVLRSLNVMYKYSDIQGCCQSSSTPFIKLAQPSGLAIPPVHHRQNVAATELADGEPSAPAAHKRSMFIAQWCK